MDREAAGSGGPGRGRRGMVVAAGLFGAVLVAAGPAEGQRNSDLPRGMPLPTMLAGIGADAGRSGAAPAGRVRQVEGIDALRRAVADAVAGDVIELQPGAWRIAGGAVALNRPGSAAAPIVVRAAVLGTVVVEVDHHTGFKITAPHWRVENLAVRGVCARHPDCEHAVHVAGGGAHAVLRNNRFDDFNAHVKVNGENGAFPDDGVILGNTMLNAAARATPTPVTPVDLVAASGWRIEANLIADFQRAGEGGPTYGAFVKGGGRGNAIVRNVVLCSWRLGRQGAAVGLSIGGGGTHPAVVRDAAGIPVEQTGGEIAGNLVAFCSAVGIYVNRGAASRVVHNTLVETAGIDVRFAESVAAVEANVVEGPIRERNESRIDRSGNVVFLPSMRFTQEQALGPLFQDPARLDLRWRERLRPVPRASGLADLCGRERPELAMPGALEDAAACR